MVPRDYRKRKTFLLIFCSICFYGYLNLLNIGFTDSITSSLLVSGQNEERKGFGVQERDREHQMDRKQDREHNDEDDDSFNINNISSLVLIGTALTIVGVSIYAGYKLYSIKKKASKSRKE